MPSGAELRRCPASVLVALLARQDDAGGLPLEQHARLDREDLAPAGMGEQLVGGRENRQLLEVLDRREDQEQLRALAGRESRGGRVPAGVDDLAAVGSRLRAGRCRRQIEPRVEADLDLGRRDPARE
jgi:hypothetical protein